MDLVDRLRTRRSELAALARLAPHVPRLLPRAPWNAARLLGERARRDPAGVGLAFGDRLYSWVELDDAANRTANAFRAFGVNTGDVVPILMDNRPEFLIALSALGRLRAVAALINTNVSGAALAHALSIVGPARMLVGSEHAARLRDVADSIAGLPERAIAVQADPDGPGGDETAGFAPFDERVDAAEPEPPQGLRPPSTDERMCLIYTSGTTGLPKAAIVSNQRFLAAGAFFGASVMGLDPSETVYVTLPLYHSSAMFAGWSAVLATGACLALRRRFSASRFWSDVRRYDASAFVYIGELCRYLLHQPENLDERRHAVRVATGNGLRPDIWSAFQERFRVPLIREFYGATEGNVALVNLAGRPGMVGRLQSGQALVRCDLETGEILRGDDGWCRTVEEGETGLLLGRIHRVATFDGYVDEEASRRKVREDVFAKGDRYFDTGDLLTLHDDGWLSFADRVGDTFRWKGENVSTNEVAEILNGAPGVLESNVYGVEVPGTEGRAGMASLRCDEDFDLDTLTAWVIERLPVYQRPYFLRVQKEMRITGTFKHQKTDYRREGFDPSRCPDPLYFLDGEKYVPLDAALYGAIASGDVSLR